MNLTDTQAADLRSIAGGTHDRSAPSSAFRRGRDAARGQLCIVLDAGTGDAFEEAAIEMSGDSCRHEDGDDYGQGWLSLLDDVRRVLPSWPWLPDTPNDEPEAPGA